MRRGRAYTGPGMARQRGRVVAGLLSLLFPGAGQLYVGARRRGLILMGISAALCLGALALVAIDPLGVALPLLGPGLLAVVLLANLALLAFRLFAIIDAWRWGRGAASMMTVLAVAALTAVAAVPHVAAAYVSVRGYDVLDTVFAEAEPKDVLRANSIFLAPRPPPPLPDRIWPGGIEPEPAPRVHLGRSKPLQSSRSVLAGKALSADHPWVTVLLLGSDAGPGQWGERTDTMILAALQRGTGRAVALGIPRNLVEVRLGGVAGRTLPRFRQPLNALYSFGRTRPELFPGSRDPGATALKQTISRLLGIRVDYYALVDLAGFADMVDALGGVDIRVKERLVDEVTRPAWGEPKPTIDVYPGRTYHFFGRDALAYVRSRKTSNDYTRMERQRCFLSAMAEQLNVLRVLRRFGSLASTVERSVRTDIPLNRVPDLIELVGSVEPRLTLTQTFGVEYIARRRASDRFPVANVGKIRRSVRDAILLRGSLDSRFASVHEAC
jgi:polyisoprenyl-teichoic acid--peptidoglycan teichoic acid transferase